MADPMPTTPPPPAAAKDKKRTLTIEFPANTHTFLKVEVARRGTTLSAVIRTKIEEVCREWGASAEDMPKW